MIFLGGSFPQRWYWLLYLCAIYSSDGVKTTCGGRGTAGLLGPSIQGRTLDARALTETLTTLKTSLEGILRPGVKPWAWSICLCLFS